MASNDERRRPASPHPPHVQDFLEELMSRSVELQEKRLRERVADQVRASAVGMARLTLRHPLLTCRMGPRLVFQSCVAPPLLLLSAVAIRRGWAPKDSVVKADLASREWLAQLADLDDEHEQRRRAGR